MGFVCFSSPTSSTASLLESCARCEGGYKASIYHPSLLLLVSLYYNVRLWSLFSVNNHGRNHSRVSQRDGAEKDSSGISAIELIGLLGSLSLRFGGCIFWEIIFAGALLALIVRSAVWVYGIEVVFCHVLSFRRQEIGDVCLE